MEKRWSKAEVAHLKRNFESHSIEELAQRFHTTVDAVRGKLDALGLGSADTSAEAAEAVLSDFSQALELLHAQKFEQAGELFEKVAASADGIQLADRARQHLAICRAQTEKAAEDSDPYLRAVFEKNNGNFEQALEICQQHDASGSDDRFAYLMASIQALAGAEDEAIGLLETAIRLEPKNRVHAYHDPDFEALQGSEEFVQLTQTT